MDESDQDSFGSAQTGVFAVEAVMTGGGWPPEACALACRAALTALADRLPACATSAGGCLSLDIELADDSRVAEVNMRYRDRARPTNVLSFPALAAADLDALRLASDPDAGNADRPPLALGTVILAAGVIATEAQAQGKSVTDHMMHLVVHGVLHILGYDHDRPDRADIMETTETRILAGLGIGDPYSVRARSA